MTTPPSGSPPPPPPPPPGWYPDPSGIGRRYWDGSTWGPQDSPPTPPTATPTRPLTPSTIMPPPDFATQLKSLKSWWTRQSVKRKATVVLSVVAGIAVVLFSKVAMQLAGSKEAPLCHTQTWSNESTAPYGGPNQPGLIGQEVRDGKLAFVVSALDVCRDGGIKLHMKVTNTGDSALKFTPSDQLLLRSPDHATGKVPNGGFECDRCSGKGEDLYINVGDSIETVVSYDVGRESPAITAFELHDSYFSSGVKVYP